VVGEAVPEALMDLIESTRFALSEVIGHDVRGLRLTRHDQALYGEHALNIARSVAQHTVAGQVQPPATRINPVQPTRERLSLWMSLARRYRHDPAELPALQNSWRQALQQLDAAADLACTGSRAPRWLAASGLACNNEGRLLTEASLQVWRQPRLFASGDCGVIASRPRPASGVWAVRCAQTLAHNLKAVVAGRELRPWHGKAGSGKGVLL
jgi:hypothetical protein